MYYEEALEKYKNHDERNVTIFQVSETLFIKKITNPLCTGFIYFLYTYDPFTFISINF